MLTFKSRVAEQARINTNYKPSSYYWFLKNFNNSGSWLSILISYGIILSLGNKVLPFFLGILTLEELDAIQIIKDRTNNLATLVGFVFTVVNMLISNLANKNPTTIKILYKHSYFYTCFYFSIITLAIGYLAPVLGYNNDNFSIENLSLSITYSSLIILVFIGVLFSNIVRFNRTDYLYRLLKEELLYELSSNEYENEKTKLANQFLKRVINNHLKRQDIKTYPFSFDEGTFWYFKSKTSNYKILSDIIYPLFRLNLFLNRILKSSLNKVKLLGIKIQSNEEIVTTKPKSYFLVKLIDKYSGIKKAEINSFELLDTIKLFSKDAIKNNNREELIKLLEIINYSYEQTL